MTELDSGRLSGSSPERPAERPAKRPAQPRAKKAPGSATTKTVKPEVAAAAPAANPQKRASATTRTSKVNASKVKVEAGPNLSDWLSLAIIVLLVVVAVGLYQWRERPSAHPLPGRPPVTQLRCDPALSHCAAPPAHRRLSA